MNPHPSCPNCGSPLPPDAPAGTCPKCLLQAGLSDSAVEVAADAADGVTLLTDAAGLEGATELPLTKRDGRSSSGFPDVGTRIQYVGDYELLREIARGGMGVVYKARQVRLNRIVALKMILAGQFASPADVQRFQTEAEAAAQLDHVGIVPVFEVGQHERHHYFSMGHVEGESLAKRIAEGPLAPRVAAEIVLRVTEAIEYAHGKGVIHRDLKPANVLLDKSGHPKVTDFGLAKRIQGESHLTASGQILGTPSFMPPEQAAGRIDEVSEAADVYSLGAILYATLTGRPPFQADNPLDTVMQVIEREPVSPRSLNPAVPLDLETICLKCLEKDRRQRYGSAGELAEELGRYLDGKPILARPVGGAERVWRWCRRNPIVAGLLATVAVSLFVGTVVSTWFAIEAQARAEGEAEQRRLAGKQAAIARQREAEALRTAAESTLSRALALCEKGDVAPGLLWMVRATELAERGGAVDVSRAARWNLASWSLEVYSLDFAAAHKDSLRCVAVNSDARLAATGSLEGIVCLWDLHTKQAVGHPMQHPGEINAVLFSRASDILVTACSDGFIRRWDLATQQLVGEPLSHVVDAQPSNLPPKRTGVRGLALSPDGSTLASAAGRDVRLWDMQSGEQKGDPLPLGNLALGVAFSGDGERLWTSSQDFMVRSWSITSRRELGRPHKHVTPISLVGRTDRDEALAGFDENAQVARFSADGVIKQPPVRLGRPALSLSLNAKNDAFVTAGTDGRVQLWHLETGALLNSSIREDSAVHGACFLAQSRSLLTVSASGNLRLWKEPAPRPRLSIQCGLDWPRQAAFSPDGRSILVSGMGDDDAWPVMFDSSTGGPVELRRPKAGLGRRDWQAGVGFATNGLLVSAENGRRFFRWDPNTGESLSPVDTEQWVWRTACSANGQRFMTGSATWNSTRYQNAARVWDITSGIAVGQPLEHRAPVWGVALSADGQLAVTGSEDHDAALWNANTGELIGNRCRHPARVKAVAISRDGRRVLTGGEDGFARLWATPGWEPTDVSVEQRSAILSVDFSPDGERFMTASADGVARVWHSTTGFSIGPALVHGDRVNVVRCHPAGTSLLTTADDGIVRVWELAAPSMAAVTQLWQRTESLTGLRLEANGAVRPLTIPEWIATQ